MSTLITLALVRSANLKRILKKPRSVDRKLRPGRNDTYPVEPPAMVSGKLQLFGHLVEQPGEN